MNKKYKFIDGTVFDTKEELEEYIEKNFLEEIEEKEDEEETKEKVIISFEKAFPNTKIEITEGDGWFSQYKIYINDDVTIIEQRIGGEGNPKSTKEAILEAKNKIVTIKLITEKIKENEKFENFFCELYEYSKQKESEHYLFYFKIKGENEYRYETFYPNKEGNSIEKFINKMRSYVIENIEGKVEIENLDENFKDIYSINGIPINPLLERAKKIRIKVIKEDDNE